MRFCGLLTILFVGLKLTGHIAWPWLLVVAPLLAGAGLFVLALIAVAVIAVLDR